MIKINNLSKSFTDKIVLKNPLYVKSQKQNKGTNKNENRFINTKNKRGC